jgi:transposase
VPYETITLVLGLQGWFAQALTVHRGREARIHLERNLPFHVCAQCGTKTTKRYDHSIRELRDLSLSGKAVYLYVPQWRIVCPTCKGVASERLDLCDPDQVMTRRYERYIAALCEQMSLQAVAKQEGLSWSTVKRIDRKYLELRNEARQFGEVRKLCIDEVAYRKGHRYLTVVSDYETRNVIWVGKGRDKAAVAAFFAALGLEKTARIECAAMDMSKIYIAAVAEAAPQAFIVYDRFHIMKYVNAAVDQVRRDEQKAADQAGQELLKNKRYVLLHREKNLTEKQQVSLQELCSLNQNIAISHLLKEDFCQLFECQDTVEAAYFLDGWLHRAQDSKLEPFGKLCEQLDRWREGLLNYFVHRIANGLAEAINNNINVLKRAARGFRDLEYFMLKILQRCGGLPPLAQVTKTS